MSGAPSDARTVGARVEGLLADLDQIAEPTVAAKAEALVRTLVEFYGTGLARVVELLSTVDGGAALVRTLAADELLGGLLVLHDLHPDDTATRVAAALEQVRPYLGSHAGDVDLIGVDGEVVRLRLAGSCHGCPSSTVTVKLAIEAAIDRLAPEIARVEVEGVVEETAGPGVGPNGRPLLPLAGFAPAAPPEPAPSWVDVADPAAVVAGALLAVRAVGQAAVLCRVGEELYAYRDRCPACTGDLAGGSVTHGMLVCPHCARRYDVRLAGRGDDGHLDPLPLLTSGGSVRIAVPYLVAS